MKIKVGGIYETRSGEKAVVLHKLRGVIDSDWPYLGYYVASGCHFEARWNRNGDNMLNPCDNIEREPLHVIGARGRVERLKVTPKKPARGSPRATFIKLTSGKKLRTQRVSMREVLE